MAIGRLIDMCTSMSIFVPILLRITYVATSLFKVDFLSFKSRSEPVAKGCRRRLVFGT